MLKHRGTPARQNGLNPLSVQITVNPFVTTRSSFSLHRIEHCIPLLEEEDPLEEELLEEELLEEELLEDVPQILAAEPEGEQIISKAILEFRLSKQPAAPLAKHFIHLLEEQVGISPLVQYACPFILQKP